MIDDSYSKNLVQLFEVLYASTKCWYFTKNTFLCILCFLCLLYITITGIL